MKTIVIGIGNPLLTDDGVGIKVARSIKEHLGSEHLEGNGSALQVDIRELSTGGIRLMEAMEGYDSAMIIDAMVTRTAGPGTIHRLRLNDTKSTRNTMSVHDMDLPTALEIGRVLGMHLPSRIRIWGIEAFDVDTFSEALTEDVARAVPEVVSEIIAGIWEGGVHDSPCAAVVHPALQDKTTIMEKL